MGFFIQDVVLLMIFSCSSHPIRSYGGRDVHRNVGQIWGCFSQAGWTDHGYFRHISCRGRMYIIEDNVVNILASNQLIYIYSIILLYMLVYMNIYIYIYIFTNTTLYVQFFCISLRCFILFWDLVANFTSEQVGPSVAQVLMLAASNTPRAWEILDKQI